MGCAELGDPMELPLLDRVMFYFTETRHSLGRDAEGCEVEAVSSKYSLDWKVERYYR